MASVEMGCECWNWDHWCRHRIVSGITIQPLFRQPPAALDCDKMHCVGPVLSVSDSSAPSPPGSSGPALAQQKRAGVSWPFLFAQWTTERRRRESATAESRRAIRITSGDLREISAATCKPRPAWDRACRDRRPGQAPRHHRRHHAPRCRAIRSSFPVHRSSRRPSRGYAPHCGR
jgi:hypothetical protein